MIKDNARVDLYWSIVTPTHPIHVISTRIPPVIVSTNYVGHRYGSVDLVYVDNKTFQRETFTRRKRYGCNVTQKNYNQQ